jgi:hypothetical protein
MQSGFLHLQKNMPTKPLSCPASCTSLPGSYLQRVTILKRTAAIIFSAPENSGHYFLGTRKWIPKNQAHVFALHPHSPPKPENSNNNLSLSPSSSMCIKMDHVWQHPGTRWRRRPQGDKNTLPPVNVPFLTRWTQQRTFQINSCLRRGFAMVTRPQGGNIPPLPQGGANVAFTTPPLGGAQPPQQVGGGQPPPPPP